LIMVNNYSASASEIVAATLQDYNRAVIVGSPTYGKATGQSVLPMDTTITLQQNISEKVASSYIKMTLSKIYRVNGATAQFAGVTPDVVLPDIADAVSSREADEPYAIPSTGIEANKYYKPLPPLNLEQLRTLAKTTIDTASYFIAVKKYLAGQKQAKLEDISLTWKDALAFEKNNAIPSYSDNKRKVFEVVANAYDMQRYAADKNLRELQETWKYYLTRDPYLQLTFDLALKLIK
jgi:carboxyl-terminal processing protease